MPGVLGLAATFSVSETEGNALVGIRKNVAQLDNGNIIQAEIRLQNSNGDYFVRYRLREYNGKTFTLLQHIAEGNIGAGWASDPEYALGLEYTLGLVLIDDEIAFFARGVNKFCKFIVIPLDGNVQPESGAAKICSWVLQDNGVQIPSTLTARVKDVKLIMDTHLPTDSGDICDVNDDGQTGLPEAIHALQTAAGVR